MGINLSLDKDAQKRLAKFVCARVRACREYLEEDLKMVWKDCSMAAKNQPIGGTVVLNNIPNRTYPLIQPRISALVKNVANPQTSQTPYYVVKRFGGDDAMYEATENTVQFLFEQGNWRKATRQAVKTCAIADPAIIRVQIRQDDDTGECIPEFKVIHPDNFIAYPVGEKIERCVVTGEIFNELRGDILRRMKEGDYYECDISNASPTDKLAKSNVREETFVGVQEDQPGVSQSDDKIMVWEGCVRVDLKDIRDDGEFDPDAPLSEDWYLVKVVVDTEELLALEKFGVTTTTVQEDVLSGEATSTEEFVPFPRPWYFEYSFTEAQEGEFFRETWFARELLDLQKAANENWALLFGGTLMNAFPAGFAQGDSATMQNIAYGPGSITFVPNPLQIQWVKPNFDQGAMPGLMEKIDRLADAVANITSAGTGQQFDKGTSATAAAGYLAAQNTSLEEYRENASSSAEPICEWLRFLAKAFFFQIKAAYPGMPCEDPMLLDRKCVWEPNGKSGDNQPQVVLAKVEMVMQWALRLGIMLDPQMVWQCVVDAIDAPMNKEQLKNAVVGIVPNLGGAGVPQVSSASAGAGAAEPGNAGGGPAMPGGSMAGPM